MGLSGEEGGTSDVGEIRVIASSRVHERHVSSHLGKTYEIERRGHSHSADSGGYFILKPLRYQDKNK